MRLADSHCDDAAATRWKHAGFVARSYSREERRERDVGEADEAITAALWTAGIVTVDCVGSMANVWVVRVLRP